MAGKFAVITGASTGIGLELAKIAAAEGYELLLVADTPFTEVPGGARTLEQDLSTFEGVDALLAAAGGRQIDVLCANAGHGLGRDFLGQDPTEWRHVIDTNITGTIYLLQKVLNQMVARGEGKVLVTGSIAGYMPGSFQAVYNGTKAFVDNFTDALRNELKDQKGITLTTLMPGPTDTAFFERADLMDTDVGTDPGKDEADKVARDGWAALMDGKASIVSGWKNKLQITAANITPNAVLAERHRQMAEPGSAND